MKIKITNYDSEKHDENTITLADKLAKYREKAASETTPNPPQQIRPENTGGGSVQSGRKNNSRFSEAEMKAAVQANLQGESAKSVCDRLGISVPTFYNWKRKYKDSGASEAGTGEKVEGEGGAKNITKIPGSVLLTLIGVIVPMILSMFFKGKKRENFALTKSELSGLSDLADAAAESMSSNIDPMTALILGVAVLSASKGLMGS